VNRAGMFLIGLAAAVSAASAFAQSTAGSGESPSPVGRWQTFDPGTHELRSIVEITAVGDELEGKVIKRFPPPGDPTHGICSACPGGRKNQPILGMTILWHLQKRGDGWGDGTIIDPTTGKTYSLEAHLTAGGKELLLRGYVGMPLFGQTRTWVRDTSD
jgi:uncharacterized protein (DUF2147 family)